MSWASNSEDDRQRLEKAMADGAASVEPDFEFHLAIARATRNRFFVISLEALRAKASKIVVPKNSGLHG